MDSIRIACVRYFNTAPLVEGLSRLDGVSLVFVPPARIAPMLVGGEADVGLASMIDSVQPPGLDVLGAGIIGSDGPTHTVRLYSRVPIDRIRRLHADPESHSSVALARVLLRRVHGITPEIVAMPPEADAEAPEAMVLIGDKVALRPPPASIYVHGMDLGEAWREWTGLPFVYAAWMASPSASDDAVTLAASILDRQRRRNSMRLDWIVSRRAPEAGWDVREARRYAGELLRYDLGEPERRAAQRFIDEAADLGIVPRASIRWRSALVV